MQKEGLENILYVGLDDSNHAGERRGEIVVATFSFNHEDSLVKNFRRKRDFRRAENWLKNSETDYRFCVLMDEKFRHIYTNLPYTAPFLINSFLKDYSEEVSNIKIYLDGFVESKYRNLLKKSFSDYPNLAVDYFIKRRGIHNCPNVVYMAHLLSHNLYSKEFPHLSEHEKRFEIN